MNDSDADGIDINCQLKIINTITIIKERIVKKSIYSHPTYDLGGIQSENGETIFFYFDSVCGNQATVGSSVCFPAFPGSPYSRDRPVVLIEGVNTNP